MTLPVLSHLQATVLGIIEKNGKMPKHPQVGAEETAGEVIREELKKLNIKNSGPGFYQLMSRLEAGKMVSGRYIKLPSGTEQKRHRVYILTAKGRKALDQVFEFYDHLLL